MAKTAVSALKIVGLALVVVGAGLLYWGYQLSQSIGSQLAETFAGSMPDDVMVRYIAGAVCLVVGLYLLIKR
jgi:uncharacterized membrane protein YfcA